MDKLVRTPNLTELTYRSIKHTILLGNLDRSFRLTEEYLAKHLGISKSPVREALNRLEAEGLIRIEARRGAYVRRFSSKEIRDLYDLRMILEDYSIATAVITPSLLAELAASIARTERNLGEGDRLKHVEEDLLFHAMIAEATGNEELAQMFDNVQQKSVLCRMESYDLSASRSPSAHKKIYQALMKGDRKEARKAMEEHILFVRDRLLAKTAARGEDEPESSPSGRSAKRTQQSSKRSTGRPARKVSVSSRAMSESRVFEPLALGD